MNSELLQLLLKATISEEEKPRAVSGDTEDFVIGTNYLIRTVTMVQVGRCVKVTDKFITLAEASWVADTSRFGLAIKEGLSSDAEIERFWVDAKVGIGAIIDAVEYAHALPKATQ
jgi:hypothetical protein